MVSPSVADDILFATSQKVDLTRVSFLAYILPPFVSHYLMGVFVQLEETHFYRLSLLPIVIWFSWRATFVDMSRGDATRVQLNSTLATHMCLIATRSAVWAFARVRYHRYRPASDHSQSDPESTIYAACWNTWDLILNVRGIGWNWPRGLVVPKPMFETESRLVFVLSSATCAAFHALAFDACTQAIRILSPDRFGSVSGGVLFDGTLPPVLELVRAVLVTVLGGASTYFVMQNSYHVVGIICVVVFRQRPSQWPPLFDAPWRSTSLSELWGRRFHQVLRETLLTLGAEPFTYLFGRLGGILGAFLVSGFIHDLELRSSGRGGNTLVVVGFWVMNGVGVVLERVWTKVTGRSVGGAWGWLWMFVWLMVWGVPTVNEYAKVGRFGALKLPGGIEPSLAVVAFIRRVFSSRS